MVLFGKAVYVIFSTGSANDWMLSNCSDDKYMNIELLRCFDIYLGYRI